MVVDGCGIVGVLGKLGVRSSDRRGAETKM